MTELTGIDAVAAFAAVILIPIVVGGVWLKKRAEHFSRLVEQDEAELARRPAE